MQEGYVYKLWMVVAFATALNAAPLAVHAKSLQAKASRGATTPFTTYEAENDSLGAGACINVDPKIKEGSSDKSYVHLDATGQYVEFKRVIAANRLILRYSIPKGSAGTLSLYINGTLNQKISLDSAHCYDNAQPDVVVRRYEEKIVTAKIPAGSAIKLQKDSGDTCSWYGIDLIDLETAPGQMKMPANYLSIADYGAKANDNSDSKSAIESCIADAAKQHKGVWIPTGTFNVSSRISVPSGVAIQGAGYWHSCIYFPDPGTTYSDAIGFKLAGNNKIANLKLLGNGTSRDNSSNLFRGIGNYVTIDRCWIQNVGCICGWSDYHDTAITNSRIYGTYFDCIHWGDGAAYNNLARNNYFRGAGDDAIAQVNRADMGLAHNNVAEFNTIVASYWGRGISDVGGDSLIVRDNIISSTYNAGIIITTEPLGPSASRPIRGLKILRNTILYCGHTGHNHASIHTWLFTNPMQDVVIDGCIIKNGETEGIHFDKTAFGDSDGRTRIKNTIVQGCALIPYSNQNDKIDPVLSENMMK